MPELERNPSSGIFACTKKRCHDNEKAPIDFLLDSRMALTLAKRRTRTNFCL